MEIDGVHLAYRRLDAGTRPSRPWSPAELDRDEFVIFHGYFDNAAEIARDLGSDSRLPAEVYGRAVQRWGDDAERRIVGDYCAVMVNRRSRYVRLSRSPLKAPPLYYFHGEDLIAVSSVPRALFAAGVERRLNESRIADTLLGNFSNPEAAPFHGVAQVPTGSIVELAPARTRALRTWYDVLSLPFRNVDDDRQAIETAASLLDAGVRACLAGFTTPGSTLSGGLDSPQVAIRALAALPDGKTLPTFTFHPDAGFDGRVPAGKVGDERPLVEALAAMHPRLEPHFTSNEGYGHDHRCLELFHLIGDPAGVPGTYVFHGLLAEAQRSGCDLLLLAELGNLTFSDRGECGFVEYLLTGRWRQLWLALTKPSIHSGSIARRFAARSLSALLPDRIWEPLRRIVLRRGPLSEYGQPLSPSYRRRSGADERLRRCGSIDRYQPWNRRQSRQLLATRADPAPFYQGLEQMYGVALRDPTAYRPFVEYCLSLPTKMFMRDGETRWLAKQMAKGIMPEEQRRNMINGWWDADWHRRIGRRRGEWLAELSRIEADERLGGMFDVGRLRAALEDWPETTLTDPKVTFPIQLAVPAALISARFINYVEGRNEP